MVHPTHYPSDGQFLAFGRTTTPPELRSGGDAPTCTGGESDRTAGLAAPDLRPVADLSVTADGRAVLR